MTASTDYAVGPSRTDYNAKPRASARAKTRGHAWKIYALDKRSGKILWERTAHEGVPRARRHVKATQANSTPATDGRVVVALMGSEGLFAYDVSGKLLWKQDLGVLNPGLWDDKTSSWGHASSPVIHKNLVIVQADGHAQSFIAATTLRPASRRGASTRRDNFVEHADHLRGRRARTTANGGRYVRGYDPHRQIVVALRRSDRRSRCGPARRARLIYITGGYPPGRAMYAFRPARAATSPLKAARDQSIHRVAHDEGQPLHADARRILATCSTPSPTTASSRP